jgi:hypothetical protein
MIPDAECPCGAQGPQSLNYLCQTAASTFPPMKWEWLRAIAQQESSSCANQLAFDPLHGPSLGIFQINLHGNPFARGSSPQKLVDDCTFNAEIAAKTLNDALIHSGHDLTKAFGIYFAGATFVNRFGLDTIPPGNTLTPRQYAQAIEGILNSWAGS